VVDTNTGRLFRVSVRDGANSSRRIAELVLRGGPLPGGDGMLIDGGKLIVVAGDALNFVKLKHGGLRGRVVEKRTDPTLRGPSTIARARDRYLVVNADFAQNRKPFTVSALPR
jgi:hypothetical protein